MAKRKKITTRKLAKGVVISSWWEWCLSDMPDIEMKYGNSCIIYSYNGLSVK